MGDPVCEGPAAAGWHARIWPRRDAGPLAAVMTELIDWLAAEGGPSPRIVDTVLVDYAAVGSVAARWAS